MRKRKRAKFYRPYLEAVVRQQANPHVPVRRWLKRLQQLNHIWSSGPLGQESSQEEAQFGAALAGSARECYEFLACLGALQRTRLMKYRQFWTQPQTQSDLSEPIATAPETVAEQTAGPVREAPAADARERSGWYRLASDYEPALRWTETLYREYGLALVASGLGMFDPEKWLQKAEELAVATEFADPANVSGQAVQHLTKRVRQLWEELDAADLFIALANLAMFYSESTDWERFRALTQVSYSSSELWQQLERLQARLVEVHAWLHDHPEPFFLIDDHIQAVALGFRKDLHRYCDLYLTAEKYAAMLDALEVAEGVAPMFWKAAQYLQAELARRQLEEMRQWYYPREEVLEPLLAAASGTAALSRVLRWEAPDKRYVATLLISGEGVVLRFFTRRGSAAAFLEGEQVYLAGVCTTIDEDGWAIIPLERLLDSEEDLYLEVGRRRIRWRPLPQSTPN